MGRRDIHIVDEDLEYLFETYGRESYVQKAVVQLISLHREEYEELAGDVLQNEVDRLKGLVSKQGDTIRKLEALNPKRVNVPMLTETANRLQKSLEEKEDKKAKKRGRRG